MKIGIVTTEYIHQNIGGGGLASYVYRISQGLQKEGHSVVVVLVNGYRHAKCDPFTPISFLIDRDILRYEIQGQKIIEIPYYSVGSGGHSNLCFPSNQEKKKRVRVFKTTLVIIPRPKYLLFRFKKLLNSIKKKTHAFLFRIRKSLNTLSLEEKKKTLYGSYYDRSKIVNKLIEFLHQIENFDILHYTNLDGLVMNHPPNIPSVVRVSGIHSLWYQKSEKEMNTSLIQQDLMEWDALSCANQVIVPSYCIADIIHARSPQISLKVIESPFVRGDDNTKDESVLETFSLKTKKYVLFFGQISPLKGIIEITKVLHQILSYDPSLYYVFVGHLGMYRSKSIKDVILDSAKEHKDRVIIIERLIHAQLFPIINYAHFITLPSRIDNLPNACIEAMALGKIVIGAKGASFDQLITNGENGFLCEKENAMSFFNTFLHVLNLSEEKKHKIEDSARKITDRLEPNVVVEQLVQTYKQVIAQANGKG